MHHVSQKVQASDVGVAPHQVRVQQKAAIQVSRVRQMRHPKSDLKNPLGKRPRTALCQL